MKIAIAFATMRPQVMDVAAAFIENIKRFGHAKRHELCLILSVDSSLSESLLRFVPDPEIQLYLLRPQERQESASQLLGTAAAQLHGRFLSGDGYAPQRNAAVILALQQQQDHILFFDDDEYPIIPIQTTKCSLDWLHVDVLGDHLHALSEGADVTWGRYLGYPIPLLSLSGLVAEAELRALGAALSLGCEVLNENSFCEGVAGQPLVLEPTKNAGTSTLVWSDGPSPGPRSLSYRPNTLDENFRSGNLGINLQSIRTGKIPFLFYNPPMARGEDILFFSAIRGHAQLRLVDSFIFHDPFQEYLGLLHGMRPPRLAQPQRNTRNIGRFIQTLYGWLRYAPLLIAQGVEAANQYQEQLDRMCHALNKPLKALEAGIGQPLAEAAIRTLKESGAQLANELATLNLARLQFRTRVLNQFLLPIGLSKESLPSAGHCTQVDVRYNPTSDFGSV